MDRSRRGILALSAGPTKAHALACPYTSRQLPLVTLGVPPPRLRSFCTQYADELAELNAIRASVRHEFKVRANIRAELLHGSLLGNELEVEGIRSLSPPQVHTSGSARSAVVPSVAIGVRIARPSPPAARRRANAGWSLPLDDDWWGGMVSSGEWW